MSQRAHGITAAAGEHCAIWVGDVGGREAAKLIWKSENPSEPLSPWVEDFFAVLTTEESFGSTFVKKHVKATLISSAMLDSSSFFYFSQRLKNFID